MKYIDVKEGDIPGTIVRDGKLYSELGGRYFEVKSLLYYAKRKCMVPILDIPMMSDERWNELAAQRKAANA